MIDYASAGVDIAAGNEVVSRIKEPVKQTFDSHVITELGGFAALYDLKGLIAEYDEPVLVQSIDGLGTKPMIAAMMNQYDTLGEDLLSATANDILVCGAKPLTLLDYIGGAKIKPDDVVALVESISRACIKNGVSLVGGETAEMPGVYSGHEYDVVGVITGVVEKRNIINGKNIKHGDCVLGFASNGLHTNGYSLARKLCFELAKLPISEVGPALLMPHVNYTRPILALCKQFSIKGMAHITGGGLLENVPRILPPDCSVELQVDSWPQLPIFDTLVQLGALNQQEAYRTFNMGIGYVMVTDASTAQQILAVVNQNWPDFKLYTIGRVVSGQKEVILK